MTTTSNAPRVGLPPDVLACLFDLDGVLTDTVRIHAAAWADVFDEYLRDRSRRTGEPFRPFTEDDHRRHVDGRPRADGVRAFLQARGITLRDAGLPHAVVSASAHCAEIMAAAGVANLVDVRVDGLVARSEGLRGKPYPDTFLAAARRLHAAPSQAAVFEDAVAGVRAGQNGEFRYVVGVDRVGHREELLASGADIVVPELTQLLRGVRA